MPDNRTIEAKSGVTLLDMARSTRVSIRTRCEGKAGCLMCKVQVAGEGISPPTAAERQKLGIDSSTGLRLACQAKITASGVCDLVVTVPEDPLKAAVRRQLQQQEDDELW
ncbi:2Fe-2S iron-sulfur cluster-binding protein [Paenibacillus sp. ACRRX]|nr:2Fe-2S iron-sulfur cluster-binding protein [Paenibacillus sp. ACRRX]MCG7406435.1 2Fe-2S iron-sulfur cluster-binding protein [Paenibacillus sp. ACRRX]MDK8179467.1 2Fe-2S iron-sulfur cluster-binding protein [Paenibacillus sp. UMB4589-SE434]